MPFTKDSARDDITRELLMGATPGQLSKKYPVKSVYRIYNELSQSGQLSEPGVTVVDSENEPVSGYPFELATSKTQTLVAEKKEVAPDKTGAEVLDFTGPKSLPLEAVNRLRGILGITFRPKVLSCPTPELLYPAMVISVTELGFKPMRPDDFIDTVLYQWLEACDIVPYAFMKRNELDEMVKNYGVAPSEYIKEHGLMTKGEFAEKYGITLPEESIEEEAEVEPEVEVEPEAEVVEPMVEALKEEIVEMQEEAEEEARETGDEPRKPTVGDLLARLHINSIQKEVEENGSTGRTEPDSPQGEPQPGE